MKIRRLAGIRLNPACLNPRSANPGSNSFAGKNKMFLAKRPHRGNPPTLATRAVVTDEAEPGSRSLSLHGNQIAIQPQVWDQIDPHYRILRERLEMWQNPFS
jgi:hypothetical protein